MLSMNRTYFVLAACMAVSLCGCPRKLPPSIAVNANTIDSVRGALEEGVSSGDSGEAEVVADPTGWATFSGTFTVSGAVPPPSALPVTKDVAVCAPGGKQVLDDILLVGSNGGLQNVLVYINSDVPDGNAAWIHESYESQRGAEVLFDQKDCMFTSRLGVMWKAQTLKILNSDPVGHNTNLASKRGANAQDVLIPANSSADYHSENASPTPFPVSCAIHPWMKASMMVCDNPYFAVTDANGKFSIPNVPTGVELEFRVWHEKAGFVQPATVDNASQKWSKGKFKRTLTDSEDVTMNVVIEASAF
jgi:hypothetical protein